MEPDPDSHVVESVIEEGGDLGIVGEDVQDFSSGSFSPAPWVETVFGAESFCSGFNNAPVPPATQGTFPYICAVSKFLQPGAFDLVGTIVYEIDQNPYQSTFYNETIEVNEAGGLLHVKSVFLFCLGIALIGLLVFWMRSQIQQIFMSAYGQG